MYIAKDVTPAVARRQRIERAIVRKVVHDALAAGYVLSVNDGGDEMAAEGVTTMKAAMDALMNTDQDFLFLTRDGKRSWISFVYGNDGWDVISDYGCSARMEELMNGIQPLIDKLEARAWKERTSR